MDIEEERAERERPGFLERLSGFLSGAPEDRQELLDVLYAAHERSIIDSDALSIIEGALFASEKSVSDVMVPRPEMHVIEVSLPLPDIIAEVNKTGHSRFPVIEEDRDHVLGILLAKDLLKVHNAASFDLRAILRPALFIPEFKRLNVLLREFRLSHHHMAIVLDEYAGVSGLVTIEDVLEEIVGEIEDEYDDPPGEAPKIRKDHEGRYHMKAQTALEDVSEVLGVPLSSDDYHTIGGLIIGHMGRVPRPREVIDIGKVRIMVMRADGRKIHTVVVLKKMD